MPTRAFRHLTTIESVKLLDIRRKTNFAIGALARAAVATAVSLQLIEDLTPCPLCILQRVFLLGVSVSCFARGVWPRLKPLSLAAAGFAVACAITAGQHYYEQTHPLEFSTCAPGFEAWWNKLAVVDMFPLILKATGQCMLLDSTVLGIPMPLCSLAVALSILTLIVAQALAGRHTVR